jgi:hypothetical protein
MTPNDVISEVRNLIQDTQTPQRYSDAVLLNFVNQTLKRMAMIRPDLFTKIADITTTANTVIQTMPSDSIRLVEIFSVKDGNSLTEVNRDVFDQTYPGWTQEAAGTPVNFMRHVRNPNQFFLYPRPTSGVILVGEYAVVPTDYDVNDPIVAPIDAYFPTVVDGTVYLAESIDNEHVNSGRAKLYYDSFVQSLATSLSARELTDTKQAALPAQQVI